MSIINDALKKAGQPMKEKTEVLKSSTFETGRPAPIKTEIRPAAEVHRKKNSMNWGPFFIVIVMMLVTGPIIAPLFRSPSQNLMTTKLQSLSGRLQQFGIEETPTKPNSSAPSFSIPRNGTFPDFALSGVVYSQSESYCLINGKVVKVGEKIDSQTTLEKVTPNFVTLNRQGEKIVIPVNS